MKACSGESHEVEIATLSGCTPELRRLRTELGARLSYRDAARILQALLPCSPPTQSSIRNRLGRVADDLNDRDRMMAFEEPAHPTISSAAFKSSRLRHLLWNGDADEAWRALHSIQSWANRISEFAGSARGGRAKNLLDHCSDPKTYVGTSEAAIVDHSNRYRSKTPVASSAAEGCVDEIANAGTGKKQRMRWSPRGAHRLVTVRTATLDNRLDRQIIRQRKTA